MTLRQWLKSGRRSILADSVQLFDGESFWMEGEVWWWVDVLSDGTAVTWCGI